MFKVIGTDGKEYGPVTAEQLRQWLAQGRVNGQTKVQSGNSAEWKLLAEISEFGDDLKNRVPPPPTGVPMAPAPVAAGAAPAKTSSMAVISLVLGILGLFTCGITALVGLVLGIIALAKINRSAGRLSGNGLAIAGICTSGVFLLMIPIFAGMLLPALAKAKQKAQSVACMNNMKQLALAVKMYADDNKDQLPPAATWCDALQPFVGSEGPFKCPAANAEERCGYALNARLAGAAENKIEVAATTVLIFETEGGWNVSGGPELLLNRPRHGRAVGVAFADGHVEMVPESRLKAVRWDP
jgi:prepilin-type processing-associated H-X9-DG protein